MADDAEVRRRIAQATTTLDLSFLDLTAVPESVGQLTALTSLDLQGNQLTALPESVGQLPALTTLFLQNNQLTAVPESVGQLPALTTLFLQNNQLTALPESVGQLTALATLDLDSNQLTALPESVGQLTALTSLDLQNNQLTALPESVGQLTALISLFLQNNRLTALPESVGQLTALTTLFLQNNPLGLSDEILAATPAAILEHHFRSKQAARPLNEVKLLLVGRGGAGKTSIVKRLRSDEFDAAEKETPGISILPWSIRKGTDEVRVHVWDFAGQVITHSTHQFFLTHRSVYVLVLTGRERQRAGRCRVLVAPYFRIRNRCQDRRRLSGHHRPQQVALFSMPDRSQRSPGEVPFHRRLCRDRLCGRNRTSPPQGAPWNHRTRNGHCSPDVSGGVVEDQGASCCAWRVRP